MREIRGVALDHEFVVRSPEPLAGVLADALAPLAVRSTSDDDDDGERIDLRCDDDGCWVMRVAGSDSPPMSPGRALAHVLEHVNRRAADSIVDEIPLHAAAVEHPDGGIVALAGSSGAGKSTLGAVAVRSGWGFVAEEVTAVRTDDRSVRPYHRPIGLRAGGAAAVGVTIPAAEWFSEVYPWPVPVEARRGGGTLLGIALVERVDGESSSANVRPARALAELVEHTVVPSPDRIVPVFRALDELVREVPVVRLSVGAGTSAVEFLADLMTAWRP